jgi:cell surface protein SprA
MKSLIPFSIIAIVIFSAARFPVTRNISSPYFFGLSQRAEADTIPPIQDRTGDFLRNPNTNPIDLKDPKSVEKKVELDPVTGRYILSEKIGDEDFRPSTFMSFEEYLEYRRKQDERDYFNYLSGATSDGKINSLDPISKIDVQNSLIDRLFGGTEVDIKPQGNIDLTFGFDIQRLENPILLERQRTTGGFNFDMAIQMNVTGKIGSKLTLSTNYNTNATFNFDNQIKINYNTDALTDPFSEDAIIKKIEAGNVSLPLRGTLIQGAQSLFGVKTELQFGRLRLTSVISQQNSQKKNLKVEGGSQLQEFEVRADEYDENRHFFLSFYNQETFEDNLSNLPQVRSLFKLENIEVWITNNRNEVDDVREIVAFADLAEPSRLVSPDKVNAPAVPVYPDISRNRGLPSNDANDLYARVTSDPMLRQIDNVVAGLQGAAFNMEQAQDFEKVFARKLKPSEYTVNQELGFVSLGVNVQPDQVVAVTYSYSYNGKLYFVGDRPENIATTTIDSVPQVLFAKMLKSTVQRTDVPTWELMMKNVYPIGAYQVDPKEFRLDVFYEDPGKGIKRFLPFSNLEGRPLLRVFQLDKLNTQGDPQPDGIFDFVPGVTINTRNGRVMFPVLEPFGRSLGAQIDDPALRDSLVYQALYDSTLFQAREFPEKNRFIIKGSYKSSVSAEISLGAFNIPPGSVSVTAGGQRLIEGQDYEIDYNIGRVRILNDALLQSGVPVNVSYEDNTLFGFQTKTMLGLRADYEISKKLNLGATFMQLFERPFTPKVNIGDDPINNRIYGFDVNYSTDAPILTKIADALPLISTKAPSSFNFSGEAALLAPGNARAINQNRNEKEGVVYIDDFEGTSAGLDLRQPVNQWFLSSVPQNNTSANRWPEGNLINDVTGGANRAKLNWYRIDLGVRNREDERNPYTSLVDQNEVFPNINVTPDQLPNVQTFDLTYYPRERGPYNFDLPGGYPGFTSGITFDGDSLLLNDPETRWGGIMRSLNTVDFQTANIEYLEFWMLSPFINPDDPNGSLPQDQLDALEGSLYFHLGNLSEDILRDSRKFFENGLPTTFNPNRQTDTTAWGIVPVAPQITRFFDNDRQGGTESRQQQDVGLDGLSDEGEREHFRSYIEAVRAVNPAVAAKLERDPSNDNFRYFRDDSFNDTDGILQRYRDFNNPQGNSPENTGQAFIFSSTNIPDAEDLNQDNTLNETEAYFQYRVPIFYDRNNPKEIDMNTTPFITDRRAANNGRVWYRFRIPLSNTNSQYSQPIGGIRDFRSIRFMRMIMKDFAKPVTLRFATLELVRNQWRRYQQDLSPETSCQDEPVEFNIDAVNIEENIGRQPFNYVLPLGIQRERSLGVFNALQNEQSLSLNVKKLCDGEDVAVFKTINLDLRVYEKLRMFTHAEAKNPAQQIDPGDLSIFVRIGSDFKNNYYEYEIPLVMSDPNLLPANPNSEEYKLEVWRPENEFDFALELLRNIKEERNQANIPLDVEYVRAVEGRFPGLFHQVKVRGNPNLGLAKQIMVGVRNPTGGNNSSFDFEAWINELRLVGLDDRAAGAAVARADIQMADLASFTLSANYSSIGFGALNQKVAERSREAVYGYDFAANVQLNKFLPEKWGINLPFYGQLSNVTRRPEYDPFDLDVPLKLKLSGEDDIAARDSIRNLALDVTRLRSVNFTNVRKEKTGSTTPPKPWDISNFSANYSYTQTDRSNPLIESDAEDRTTGGIDYAYSKPVKYIEPFKNLIKNDKFLKLITSFNFNPIPNALTFRTVMNRQFAETRYRFTGLPDRFSTFYNKRFTWDRDVNLQWDMAKALKFNFSARTNAVVDEPDESWMQDSPFITDINQFRKDSIWSSIRNLGRIKNYAHNFNLNYTLPTKAIPFMDWVQVRAQYQAEYNWTAIALNVDSLGNVVQNKQRRQLNADFNFDNLYGKIGYLRNIERPATQPKKKTDKNDPNADPKTKVEGMAANTKEDKKKEERTPSAIERALIRPLLMLRKARFTWSEDFSTSLPGFMQQAGILGMGNGFTGPGWDFIAGLQPNIRTLDESNYYSANDWLHQVGNNKGWLSASVFQNREVLQDYSQKFDGRITIEPYRDFRIEVDITRNYTEGHAQFFKDTIADGVNSLVHAIPKKNGSMAISYFALGTPMTTDAAEIRRLFGIFDQNRTIISQRLGQGPHTIDSLAARGYTLGYGNIQNEVILPAFIAAYTGKDAQTVGLDIFKTLPSPSWRLNYNGLSKLPWFSDVFQNFSLTHGYKGTLTVNRFDTNPLWLDTRNQFGPDPISGNFYARFLIPEVVIQEAFSPLIAVDATLKNGMSFRLDYKRSRTLGMSFVSYQLAETQSKEITVGFGYLLRDFDIPFLTGSNKKGAKKPEPKNNAQQQQNNNRGGGNRGGGQLRTRDLDFNFNMSLRDDVTFNHLLDQGIIEPVRGNYALNISPSAEYQINTRLGLRLFFDYRQNIPRTSAGFPRIDTSGGLVVRFKLI